MKLILGSQSKNRQEVLLRAGIEFEVLPADIDEKAIRTSDYAKLPLLIARAKADALLQRIDEPALLVTADTVVTFQGELREKPLDPAEARRFLESYSAAEPMKVITGVSVVNTATQQRADETETVLLTIRALPERLVDELLTDPATYTVAGGFTVYDPRIQPYIDIQPGTLESVAGLPLQLMQRLITEVSA